MDAAPEVQAKITLPKKHLIAKEKKFKEDLSQRLASLHRANDGTRSANQIRSSERFQRYGALQEIPAQEENKESARTFKPQQSRAESLYGRRVGPELQIDADSSKPQDLATLWNFMQDARAAVSTTNFYSLSNHFHRGTYNYSPAFNPSTVGNSNFIP